MVPQVTCDWAVDDAAPKPGSFTARLNSDLLEIYQVNLNAIKGSKTMGKAVATVKG